MAQVPVVVVLDDDGVAQSGVRQAAERLGFRVVGARASEDAARLARDERAHAVIMPAGATWPDTAHRVRAVVASQPRCRVIVAIGRASAGTWSEAAQAGAYGLAKAPLDPGAVASLLELIRDEEGRRREIFTAEAGLAAATSCCGLLGRGPAMQALFERARRLAPHLRTALVVGERGTGKHRLACALHALGSRHARPFVVVECDVADPVVLEASLFGGGLPGNGSGQPGLVAAADGGMVYVEDVTRLPARAQERLLDLLEGGGADPATHRFDVVVVAGAVKHPRQEVQAGRFSADLLARLSAVEFLLPPLRDRREDVLPLASALLHEAAGRAGKYVEGFAPEAEAVLLGSRWPGNVGQLRDVIERACLLADGGLVLERDLLAAMPPVSARALLPLEDEDAGQPLSTVEREHIMRALQRAGGNKKAAARMLGVSRRALYRKLERLDLGTTIARRPRTRPAALHPGPGPDQGHGLTMRALSGLK